jgi:hypothetical protein
LVLLALVPGACAPPRDAGSRAKIRESRARTAFAVVRDNLESDTLAAFITSRRPPDIRPLGAFPIDPGHATPPPPCPPLAQGAMIHVFDTTSLEGGPWYVNDHTLTQAPDGLWHLFGIFHHEPVNADAEVDFIHAVSDEPDIATWRDGTFHAAPGDLAIALTADRSLGETHLWAPHVVAAAGRWFMIYQGGGDDGDHASIRLAESDDLYRWRRASNRPLFEDFCVARDPMLVRRDPLWSLYYTRCESPRRRVSGVAHRTSADLVHWSAPTMALTLGEATERFDSGHTESPFVFERGDHHYLSVTAYPIGWDATFVYRSHDPLSFPDAPIGRLRAHAAEWLFDGRGQAYATHAGPGQRGVWISRVDLPDVR